MNLQPWWFSVIQDRERLKRYSERAKWRCLEQLPTDPRLQRYEAMLRDEAFNIFYDAGTLVVIGSIQPGPFHDADCWLAAANLMLAACGEGLATCCIGFAVEVLNEAEVKAELCCPPDGVAVAPIILGYPRGTTPVVPRAEPRIASWIQALAEQS
jgi:nitroreductase